MDPKAEYEAATERGIRRRGFGGCAFEDALARAKTEADATPELSSELTVAGAGYKDQRDHDDSVPRTSDSADPGDRTGHEVKPDAPYWTSVPVTEEEKTIYYGRHIHTPDNPLGLHSHVPGGPLLGGHTHGPQNRLGAHHHKEVSDDAADPKAYMIDGHHVHQTGTNMPCGSHEHVPENFA